MKKFRNQIGECPPAPLFNVHNTALLHFVMCLICQDYDLFPCALFAGCEITSTTFLGGTTVLSKWIKILLSWTHGTVACFNSFTKRSMRRCGLNWRVYTSKIVAIGLFHGRTSKFRPFVIFILFFFFLILHVWLINQSSVCACIFFFLTNCFQFGRWSNDGLWQPSRRKACCNKLLLICISL